MHVHASARSCADNTSSVRPSGPLAINFAARRSAGSCREIMDYDMHVPRPGVVENLSHLENSSHLHIVIM